MSTYDYRKALRSRRARVRRKGRKGRHRTLFRPSPRLIAAVQDLYWLEAWDGDLLFRALGSKTGSTPLRIDPTFYIIDPTNEDTP